MTREFMLSEAQAMAPLVRTILFDLAAAHRELNELDARIELLEDCRRSRNFAVRSRFYAAAQEREEAHRRYVHAAEELEDLGVELIDSEHGVAGFAFNWAPSVGSSRVRRATFLLKLDDEPGLGIFRWRFEGERVEHRVPSHWREDARVRPPAKVKPVAEI